MHFRLYVFCVNYHVNYHMINVFYFLNANQLIYITSASFLGQGKGGGGHILLLVVS